MQEYAEEITRGSVLGGRRLGELQLIISVPLCDDLPHAIARFGSDRPDLTFPDAHHDYGLFLLARQLQENSHEQH
jgi:hypothetical protein